MEDLALWLLEGEVGEEVVGAVPVRVEEWVLELRDWVSLGR